MIRGAGQKEGAKKVVVNTLMMRILMYSAIKIRANIVALYSTLNPDTSSDSPSAKSNGVRLVSAREDTNHIITRGGPISIGHTLVSLVMVTKLKVFGESRTHKRIRAMLTSYEIV